MSNLKATHPAYSATVHDQILMRDCYEGERAVKNKDTEYLPATPGHILDGMESGKLGRKNYDSYKARARFPDVVSDAVEHLLGVMHQKPAKFELPKQMEELVKKATDHGEGLQGLLRRINEQQLVAGRVGLLVDLPAEVQRENPLPYIAMYYAEAMINWDDGSLVPGKDHLSLMVLNESGYKRDPASFEWKQVERYRVLSLSGEGGVLTEGGTARYAQALFEGTTYDPTMLTMPMLRGKALEEIPFVFINSKDTLALPDNPPLLGLANLALHIYRSEGDYRHCLFMQGQDTLVIKGGLKDSDNGEATRVGAGATLELDENGDAKYIGVQSTGLSELRSALENDRKEANSKAGQLVDAMSAQKESGEALSTRLRAQTATLNQIATTGAEGLEAALKHIAVWMGLNPEDVKITPNLEFADVNLSSRELVELQTAKTMGAPLSKRSIHTVMRERGITKLTYEEELAEIEKEEPIVAPAGSGEDGGNIDNQDNTPPGQQKPPAKDNTGSGE